MIICHVLFVNFILSFFEDNDKSIKFLTLSSNLQSKPHPALLSIVYVFHFHFHIFYFMSIIWVLFCKYYFIFFLSGIDHLLFTNRIFYLNVFCLWKMTNELSLLVFLFFYCLISSLYFQVLFNSSDFIPFLPMSGNCSIFSVVKNLPLLF